MWTNVQKFDISTEIQRILDLIGNSYILIHKEWSP